MTPYLWHALSVLLALAIFELAYLIGTKRERNRCLYAVSTALLPNYLSYTDRSALLVEIEDGVPLAEIAAKRWERP